jgi:uncharacterized protein (UPF0371 family)
MPKKEKTRQGGQKQEKKHDLAFDERKYLKSEIGELENRVDFFGGRLYLEIGGKFYHDTHAARVLPGFDPDTKVRMIKKVQKDGRINVELVHCISSLMVKEGKMRGDSHVLYGDQLIEDIKILGEKGLDTQAVFVSMVSPKTAAFAKDVEDRIEKEFGGNIEVLIGYDIAGYPHDLKAILSDKGYGKQGYLHAEKGITVVTAPGPGSGKMAFCMQQMYNDRTRHARPIRSGYAKIETFPVWNLPLSHPVNIAYEAATADIGDYNLIDPYHKKAYKVEAVNYNRDVENFEILKRIIDGMTAKDDPMRSIRSPTDMGIGRTKDGIVDDKVARKAALAEIVRRTYQYAEAFTEGHGSRETVERMRTILLKAGLTEERGVKRK